MFWGLKWKDPRKFVVEEMAFEFRFEECAGHRYTYPGMECICLRSLGVGKHCILVF